MKKIILLKILFAGVFLFFAGKALAATSFFMDPNSQNLTPGQSFNVIVSIDPHRQSSFMEKITINFPTELVKFDKWEFNDVWMPLSQPGYDTADNKKGILIKTAGYPKGFTKKTVFGMASFTATAVGVGKISFSNNNDDQISLDDNNGNMFSFGNSVSLNIISSSAKPVNIISFNTNSDSVDSLEDLSAITTFTGFDNSKKNYYALKYEIIDYKGDITYTDMNNIQVQYDQVFTKKFVGVKIDAGKYTLRTVVSTGTDVNTFTHDFEIVTPLPPPVAALGNSNILSGLIPQNMQFIVGIAVILMLVILAITVITIALKKKNYPNK